MQIEISLLEITDLVEVDALMKRHSQTLGFLPTEALRDHLARGGVLGAKVSHSLVGYLLYGSNPKRFRITQLCVSERFRGEGVARQLLERLKDSATTQTSIELNCRRDFPANAMWPKLGFVPIGEKPGRSIAGHLLTHWHLALHSDHQPELELFKAQTSDEALDVVIDAQVFFHFFEPDSTETEASKALLADFLVDSLKIWITDELLNEINRNDDHEQRRQNRASVQKFPQVQPSPKLVEDCAERLKQILPSSSTSQESDIRHLAKAAASEVNVFVTRDQGLLSKAPAIANLVSLQVLSPTELIVQVHQLSEAQLYSADRVAGLQLGWHRFSKEDFPVFPHDAFLNEGEGQKKFRQTLSQFLGSPNLYTCDLLKDGDDVAIVRTIRNDSPGTISMPLARVANSPNRTLYGRFLIADTLAKAVDMNQDIVEIKATAISPYLRPALLDMGFTAHPDGFVRFCFSSVLSRSEALDRIAQLSPEIISAYEDMSDLELEQHCSPLSLAAEQSFFLVPIRPGYALSLFDRQRSANDLIGGDPKVLLRWNNVYYRKKRRNRLLKPPARLLWYVSDPLKQIVAVSHLDSVDIDTPKNLIRRFRKFGVLRWEDLYEMCNRNISAELMALQFSHTFLFRERIPLSRLRAVYKEDGLDVVLRGPTRVPVEIFHRIYQIGFPAH